MIDFADVCVKRIKELGYTDAKIRRLVDISKGGIAVRRMPTTTITRYYDGSEDQQIVVQVIVARESELQTIDEIEEIAQKLPEMNLESESGSYRLTSAELYTAPQELDYTEGVSVWEMRIRAFITVY
jgi:hypothetical protein